MHPPDLLRNLILRAGELKLFHVEQFTDFIIMQLSISTAPSLRSLEIGCGLPGDVKAHALRFTQLRLLSPDK